MKPVGQILKPYEKKLRKRFNTPVELEDIHNLEFLRLPLPLLNAILFLHGFTKRQIKMLLFIARFSIGCRRSTAYLRRCDFKEIGIDPSDITSELKRLQDSNFIGWNPSKDTVWITRKLLGNSPTKPSKKVGEILTRNLVKHQHPVGNLPTSTRRKQHCKKEKPNR
ncbi:hypothetical protein H6762_03840 [Candidatus Nomurabacteria bacterium]|nr:hypothetical protein [Candidatus Nomurabacteria bacterium]